MAFQTHCTPCSSHWPLYQAHAWAGSLALKGTGPGLNASLTPASCPRVSVSSQNIRDDLPGAQGLFTHEDTFGRRGPSFPSEGAARARKGPPWLAIHCALLGTPCNVHSPPRTLKEVHISLREGITRRRLPVRTSWLMPSTEMTASGMPFPWESVTRPLMPRCTCSANTTRCDELTNNPPPQAR